MVVYTRGCQRLAENEHWAVMTAGAIAGTSYFNFVPIISLFMKCFDSSLVKICMVFRKSSSFLHPSCLPVILVLKLSGFLIFLYGSSCQQSSDVCVMAGMVSWALIVPLDVIKSRVQADSSTCPRYQSMADCAVKSFRADGVKVFFRGFWLIALRSLPVNAVTFVAYELFMSHCFNT
jgi:hypothetical protein